MRAHQKLELWSRDWADVFIAYQSDCTEWV